MKHNGNLKVAGRLSSKKIIVGDFSGTVVTSGSYMLPYPKGNNGDVLTITPNVSGDLVLTFNILSASSISYTPSITADWIPTVPTNTFGALDILGSKITSHNHIIENLETNETGVGHLLQPDGNGGLVWNDLGELKLENFYNKTETNNISAALQSEIDVLSSEVATISADLNAKTFISLIDTPTTYTSHANEYVTVNPASSGLSFTSLLSGVIDCNNSDRVYTVTNPKLSINSLPIVSLTLPTSGDTQVLASVTNIVNGAFDIVLSDIPIDLGYKINWLSFNNV